MITSRHFSEQEFNNCNPKCSLQDMNQDTINMLDWARELAGIPILLNCAFRSVDWEKKQGRTGTSSHTLGCAVDIHCTNSRNRFILIDALIKAGFNRIGVDELFIHADNSPKHDKNVFWTY